MESFFHLVSSALYVEEILQNVWGRNDILSCVL